MPGEFQACDQVLVPPGGAGSEQLGGRRVRALAQQRTAQDVVAVVRDQQQVFGRGGEPVAHVSPQLVQRVERLELDAGPGVDLVATHARADLVHGVACSSIPVADRFFDEPARAIEQCVVHAPRVDADRRERPTPFAGAGVRALEPDPDTVEQALDVPPQVPRVFPRGIVESVDFVAKQAVARGAANKSPAAASPEIDRYVQRVGGGAHRRNASGNPPSTGMTWPVVRPLRSDASHRMASAFSSGVMGCLSSVRLA